jgi:hypothetical protein
MRLVEEAMVVVALAQERDSRAELFWGKKELGGVRKTEQSSAESHKQTRGRIVSSTRRPLSETRYQSANYSKPRPPVSDAHGKAERILYT